MVNNLLNDLSIYFIPLKMPSTLNFTLRMSLFFGLIIRKATQQKCRALLNASRAFSNKSSILSYRFLI